MATNEPGRPAHLEFTLEQARTLVKAFGGDDETTVAVIEGDGHSGPGLYAHYPDCPGEGSVFLGAAR